MLKERGTHLVLGLRDIMDEPAALVPEWRRKKVMPASRDLYDQIWIYGLPQICDPLEGIDLPKSVQRKMIYTGYLHRSCRRGRATGAAAEDRGALSAGHDRWRRRWRGHGRLGAARL